MRSPVIGLHQILFLGIGGEKDATAACRSLMAKRPAARFALFPLALLLVLAAASTPIAAAKAVIKDDVSCTMCSSCDNPCQPAAAAPPSVNLRRMPAAAVESGRDLLLLPSAPVRLLLPASSIQQRRRWLVLLPSAIQRVLPGPTAAEPFLALLPFLLL